MPLAEPSYKQHYSASATNSNNEDANMNDINNPMKDMSTYDMYNTTSYSYEARDEEEASLALLIEQLEHKELQEANSLETLSMEPDQPAGDHRHVVGSYSMDSVALEPSSSSSSSRSKNLDVNDCYAGLGTLPEVDGYNYSYLYNQYIRNDKPS